MKVLLLAPQHYGLFRPLREAFTHLGGEVHGIDYEHIIKKWEKRFNAQIFRFPDRLRKKWESHFFQKINDFYQAEFDRLQPDVVFIYNNGMLLPEVLEGFKKTAKIGFFLGDHPFYTPTNRYYLALLYYGDAIFSPDSFWNHQLSKAGVKNLHIFYPGMPSTEYFPVDLSAERRAELASEILYVGSGYATSWGYKKARFLSYFTDFDLRLYGRGNWERWFQFFPELGDHYRKLNGYLPVAELNEMFNATKIVPIDGNPGVLTGVHYRLFETLSAETLPLLEWQEDLKEIFGDQLELPAVKSHEEIKEKVTYYLNNEDKRLETIARMKAVLEEKYSVSRNAERIRSAMQLG